MKNEKPNFRRKPSQSHGRRPVSNESPVSEGSVVQSDHPLHLGYIPGTEGAGRIAATKRAGEYLEGTRSFHGYSFYTIFTQAMLAKIDWTPVLTSLLDDTSKGVVATAMFRYYNYIRSRNASIANFSPVDVFFALCGVSGLATLLSSIRLRLQILCSAGSQVNGSFPEALMAAWGLGNTDRANLSSYIYEFNQIVALCKGLIMPKSFKMFARQARLAGTVFLDDPVVEKSQLILMAPKAIWRWDVRAASPTVGKLIQVATSTSLTTDLATALTLVSEYTLDQDMNNIYAEIRKAFDPTEVYELKSFPIDGEGITLEFEQVLLDEVKNATIVGQLKNGMLIVQEDSTGSKIEYNAVNALEVDNTTDGGVGPFADGNSWIDYSAGEHNIFVYTHEDQPGEECMADLVALKAYVVAGTGDTNQQIATCCTEIVNAVSIYAKNNAGGVYHSVFGAVNRCILDTTYHKSLYAHGQRAYTNFASLPVIEAVLADANDNDIVCVAEEGDIDNRFRITKEALENVHIASFAYLISM